MSTFTPLLGGEPPLPVPYYLRDVLCDLPSLLKAKESLNEALLFYMSSELFSGMSDEMKSDVVLLFSAMHETLDAIALVQIPRRANLSSN